MTEENKIVSQALSEGILIAAASALVYLVTYAYEAGYCHHFDIPRSFIIPNITTILVAAASIGTLIFSSIQLLGFSVPLLRAGINPDEAQKPYRRLFLINGVILLIGLFLLASYGFSSKGLMWFGIAGFSLNAITFGPGLIFCRSHLSLKERFEAMNSRSADAFDMWSFLIEKLGGRNVGLSFVFAIIIGIAFFIGNGEANRQKDFLLLKDYENYVLLRNYGDLIIAAPVDKNTRIIKSDFLILRASSTDKLEFLQKRIGPLKKEGLESN